MSECGVKRCHREATQAFDMYDPWPHKRREGVDHYEVCDKHAAELWPSIPEQGEYVEKERAERIRSRVVPS